MGMNMGGTGMSIEFLDVAAPPPNLPLKEGEGQIAFAVTRVCHWQAPPPDRGRLGGGHAGTETTHVR